MTELEELRGQLLSLSIRVEVLERETQKNQQKKATASGSPAGSMRSFHSLPWSQENSSGFPLNNADRIAAIFKRRCTTPWSEKEVKAFKKLRINDDDLCMVERYYAAERGRVNSICRRDIFTFLNNYSGEVDRALAWCEKHPLPSARKVRAPVQLNLETPEPTEAELQAAQKFREDFKRHMGRELYQPNGQ